MATVKSLSKLFTPVNLHSEVDHIPYSIPFPNQPAAEVDDNSTAIPTGNNLSTRPMDPKSDSVAPMDRHPWHCKSVSIL